MSRRSSSSSGIADHDHCAGRDHDHADHDHCAGPADYARSSLVRLFERFLMFSCGSGLSLTMVTIILVMIGVVNVT